MHSVGMIDGVFHSKVSRKAWKTKMNHRVLANCDAEYPTGVC